MAIVDVVMPVKNSASYISESIRSILNQTLESIRLIIVYQESNDETFSLLEAFANQDHRILLLHDEEDQGVVSALNLGLDVSTAKYIARMDADDIAALNRLENQVRFLDENSEIGVIGGWVKTFGSLNQVWTMPERDEDIQVQGFFSSMILNPTAMFRSSLINGEKSIRYRSDFKYGGEDFHFWFELSRITKFYNLQQGVLFYRIHGNNLTIKNSSQIKSNTQVTLEAKIRDLIPAVSIKELETHFEIAEHTIMDLGRAQFWFDQIKSANIMKQIYDQNALERRCELEIKALIGRTHPLVYNMRLLRKINVRFLYNRLPRPMQSIIRKLLFGR